VGRTVTVTPPDLVEDRDGRHLLVWRDLPHWMVVDDEALAVITGAVGGTDAAGLAGIIGTKRGTSGSEAVAEVNELMVLLERSGVAYKRRPKQRPLSRRPVLENVTINVTHRCNLRCAHCFFDASMEVEDSLDVRDVASFLRQGRRYLARNVNFAILGGEPLLEMDKVLALARFTQDMGSMTAVSTNGLLVDADFARAAREVDLQVQVSLDGSRPEVNDPIRGKGSFERAVRGVRTLVDGGAHTTLSMVVQRSNLHDIEDFYQLSSELGTDEVRFIGLNVMGRAIEGAVEPVPKPELVAALHDLLRRHPEAVGRVRRDYFTILRSMCSASLRHLYCGTGLKTMLIDSDGEVYPCPNHRAPRFRCGNIASMSFHEIWLGSPVLKEIRRVYDLEANNEQCPRCPVKHWCMGGCRGESYENTGEMRGPSVRCEEQRRAILDMMWLISAGEDLGAEVDRTEFF